MFSLFLKLIVAYWGLHSGTQCMRHRIDEIGHVEAPTDMSYSLNSLKGDYRGEYHGGYEGGC